MASVGFQPEPARSRARESWALWRDGEPQGENRHETAVHFLLLITLGLLLTWPLLIHGAPDLSHDGLDHARWAKQFAQQFWQGDLYPRWFTNVNGGFGGPSGFFYPPLTSYVSALFWPLMSARDPDGWRVAGFALALAQVLSGIAAYCWLRSLVKPRAALSGAALYLIAPYHLAMDIYLRGASAEAWVFVWFPLVLLSAEALLRRSRWAIAGIAASYALAVLSHPTLSLCFAAIPVAYVFLFSEQQRRIRNTALLGASLLLGVGLNAQYLLPAIFDQDKAYVAWQTTGQSDYHHQWLWLDGHELAEMGRYLYGKVAGGEHQLYWETLLKLPFVIATFVTLAAIAALLLIIRRSDKGARRHRIARFYSVAALVSFFLMLNISVWIWQTLPFLKFLQYPARLNAMLVLTVAVLMAVATPLVRTRALLARAFLFAVVLGWLVFDFSSAAESFSVWRTVEPVRYAQTQELARTQIDYATMWPRPGNLPALTYVSAFDRFVAAHPPKTGAGLMSYRQHGS